MARPQDPTARSHGLIPLVTVGALGVATALAFGRIFVGRAPTLRLILAALMAIGVGWLTRRRGLLLTTVASILGLIVALTWLVYPQTAWYGLPSLRTLRAIGRSLEYVGQQTRTQIAPAPALTPLLLAAVAAMWAASSSAYILATRAGSPLLAIVPPIALVGFADVVLEDGVRPIYAVLFLTAALAVTFSDGLRRIGQWGPVWTGPYLDRTVRSASTRSVRRVMLVAVAAAVLVPSLLPGFRSAALVDWAGKGSAVRIDPFVSIHASLNRDDPVDLFRVTSDEGAYWRMFALDTYTGSQWRMSDPNLTNAPEYPSPALLPGSWTDDATTLDQRYELLSDLGDRWVPMAFPAQTITLDGEGIRYDAGLGIAQAPDPLEEGDGYTVISRRVSPTPEELDEVTFDPPEAYGPYTRLPGDMSPEVARLARRWSEGRQTAYRQILAIQQRLLSSEFTYSKSVEPGQDANELLRFLTETRTGFCQQFSFSMAVLVRELGYPARIAVGFRPGVRDGNTFTVSSHEAHSWVEVYFEGFGWLPFEPTPGVDNPAAIAGSYLNPTTAPAPGGDQGGPGAGEGAAEDGRTGLPRRQQDVREFPDGFRGGGPPPFLPSPALPLDTGPDYSIPYRLILAIVLGVLAALAIAFPIAKWAWRFRTLHRRREAREMVLSVYRVFDGEAADLGLGRREGETLAEYRDRMDSTVSFSDGHLTALTAAATRAAYSADPIERDEALAAARAARTAIRDMRRSAGISRRVTGIYRPKL